jgi:ubiquitin carboxyl-terminal hydrolase 5/13
MTKLAIAEDPEEDKYEHSTVLKCWKCNPERGAELPGFAADAHIQTLVDGVMQSISSARQSEVKAWEEEFVPCEHTLTLQQLSTGHIPASGLAHCAKCDLTGNLWLCLSCGSLGCGRQQFGGIGGNSHGLQHFEDTGHPVSVKLGTITPEGGAGMRYHFKSPTSWLTSGDRHLLLHLQRLEVGP